MNISTLFSTLELGDFDESQSNFWNDNYVSESVSITQWKIYLKKTHFDSKSFLENQLVHLEVALLDN